MYGGYISPEGNYYPCPYGGHRPLIKALSKKFGTPDEMSKSWVHISSDGDAHAHYMEYKITQAQANTLIALANVAPPESPPDFILDWPRFEDVDVYRVAKPEYWKRNILHVVYLCEIIELGKRLEWPNK